jgi:hypothetical protein
VKEVAENVELLRELRQNLRGRLRETPLFNMGIFRQSFEYAMRDAYLKYCYENKKPFEIEIYKDDDGRLLRDCVRATDIIKRESEKEEFDSEHFPLLVKEYVEIHSLLLERLFGLYKDNAGMLNVLVQVANMLELLVTIDDVFTIANIMQGIRNVIKKFA